MTVHVLKFPKLVGYKKVLTNSADSDQAIWVCAVCLDLFVFSICYSGMRFVNSSSYSQHFIYEKKVKGVRSFRTSTIFSKNKQWQKALVNNINTQVWISNLFQHTIVNIFLPIIFSICFGCSKEPSHRDGSFEYPQHMLWLRNKKLIFLLRLLI